MGDKVVTFGNVNDFEDEDQTPVHQEHMHLRLQQRNGRKCITLIEGFPSDIDLKKVLRYFKKSFQCNGTIVTDEDNKIMQLTGDRRRQVAQFLEEEQIVPKDSIKVHGS